MSVPFRAALTAAALGCCLVAQEQGLHPQSALWAGIKQQLTGPNGEQYFESNLKGAQLPSLRGTVVGISRASENIAVLLNLSGGTEPEVRLLFSSSGPAPRKDADITFTGEPVAFSRDPFLLTLEVQDQAVGWQQSNCGGIYPVIQNYGPPLGMVINGRYHHNLTHIEFDLPPGWCIQATLPSFDNGEIAIFSHADFHDVYAAALLSKLAADHKLPYRIQTT